MVNTQITATTTAGNLGHNTIGCLTIKNISGSTCTIRLGQTGNAVYGYGIVLDVGESYTCKDPITEPSSCITSSGTATLSLFYY